MTYHVLIIDDDDDFNSLLTDIFEQADYTVTSLTNPIEAIEAFRENEYDLVVADHKMPDMTGAEFMKQCKLLRREVPVVMVSGYLDNDTIRELISEGVGGVFLKPLNIFSLLERTKSLIEEAKKHAACSDEGQSEDGERENDAKLGFPFRSFPCKSAASMALAEKLYSLRNFRTTLTLIGEVGMHYRSICEDIRGFYEGDSEHFIYLSPGNLDEGQLISLIKQAKDNGAERVTCVLLDFENMSGSEQKLAGTLTKSSSGFQKPGVALRAIFCVSRDLDSLLNEDLIDENLYILMGTAEVSVPPLRECLADLEIMAQQMVVEFARKKDRAVVPRFEKAARDFLRAQKWKGNYEALRTAVHKMMATGPGDVLTLNLIKTHVQGGEGASPRARFESHLINRQVDLVCALAILYGGDRAKVADFFSADVSAIASKL
ncbi:MAG: sigma-54-dependent transcriptional regulator [Opitutales bacterium]